MNKVSILHISDIHKGADMSLKTLLERYAMLKNLREELLASKNDGFGAYEDSAYKKTYPKKS